MTNSAATGSLSRAGRVSFHFQAESGHGCNRHEQSLQRRGTKQRVVRRPVSGESASPATLTLVAHAEARSAWRSPGTTRRPAQETLDVAQFVARVGPLKSEFTNHFLTKELIRDILVEYGADLRRTYFDVPRLRGRRNGGLSSAGVSYAYQCASRHLVLEPALPGELLDAGLRGDARSGDVDVSGVLEPRGSQQLRPVRLRRMVPGRPAAGDEPDPGRHSQASAPARSDRHPQRPADLRHAGKCGCSRGTPSHRAQPSARRASASTSAPPSRRRASGAARQLDSRARERRSRLPARRRLSRITPEVIESKAARMTTSRSHRHGLQAETRDRALPRQTRDQQTPTRRDSTRGPIGVEAWSRVAGSATEKIENFASSARQTWRASSPRRVVPAHPRRRGSIVDSGVFGGGMSDRPSSHDPEPTNSSAAYRLRYLHGFRDRAATGGQGRTQSAHLTQAGSRRRARMTTS